MLLSINVFEQKSAKSNINFEACT